MNTTDFAATVHRDGDVARLELTGEISGVAEEGLQEAFGQAGDARTVRLDFTAVDYINSTGIALIVGILAAARKSGQTVEASGLAEHYREIFRITRLSDFMTIIDGGEGQR